MGQACCSCGDGSYECNSGDKIDRKYLRRDDKIVTGFQQEYKLIGFWPSERQLQSKSFEEMQEVCMTKIHFSPGSSLYNPTLEFTKSIRSPPSDSYWEEPTSVLNIENGHLVSRVDLGMDNV